MFILKAFSILCQTIYHYPSSFGINVYIPVIFNILSTVLFGFFITKEIKLGRYFLYLPTITPIPVESINPTFLKSNTTSLIGSRVSKIWSRLSLTCGAEHSSSSPCKLTRHRFLLTEYDTCIFFSFVTIVTPRKNLLN